jgi:hypothetical protein
MTYNDAKDQCASQSLTYLNETMNAQMMDLLRSAYFNRPFSGILNSY